MCRTRRSTYLSFLTVIGTSMLAAVASAQPPTGPGVGPRGGGGGGGPPMFFGPGGGAGLELLFSPAVRDEIELVDEQVEALQGLGNKMRDGMRSVFADIRNLPEEERRDAMMAGMQEQQEKIKKEMESILLDHQLERLKQLQLQSRLQRGNTADALAASDVRETLGLTDTQLEQMRQVAQEAEVELREKIRKATEEAQSKVLDVLTSDQRAKWESMTGAAFNFQNQAPFGGGRGGRFGRGGGPPVGRPQGR